MHRTLVVVCVGLAVSVLLAATQPTPPRTNVDTDALAARAKEIFRAHCLECHGGVKTNGGVKVLDRTQLVRKEKVMPGKPEDSYLFQLVTAIDDSVMPPAGQPRLSTDDVEAIRKWIVAGAPDFPADVTRPVIADAAPKSGSEVVLNAILADVRKRSPEDRRYVRYFSLNHLLTGGITADEIDVHREALAKAINHLSWEPSIVRPEAVDAPANTVFAVDTRKLGWHVTPFEAFDGGLSIGKSKVNLYDLALLEYPYAVLPQDSDTFDRIAEEYLAGADMARPIPFVRADWFVSIVTQPGLYDDFLQLPLTLPELEQKLGVDSTANIRNGIAQRAGMTVSGVSRSNRVVERHPARQGYFWKSFDFKSNRGAENMFRDPLTFRESGGEMIFGLPNGLQGYYVSDAQGNRLNAAPTEIVADKFADDKTVRNGLSCIRCHDLGMKTFVDTVRPALLNLSGLAGFDKREALRLYPEPKVMDDFLKADTARFLDATALALGKPQTREPLIPVSRRYLENPLTLSGAAGELGLAESAHLAAMFRTPAFTSLGLLPLSNGGVIRRDAWEEYFDPAARSLGLGIPVAPLDGTLHRDHPAARPPFAVGLETNKKNNTFEPGDELRVIVANRSDKPLFVELVGTSAKGRKVLLVSAKTKVEPGKVLTYPEEGKPAITIRGGLGREQITLYASDGEFPSGLILRGKDVADRVVHSFHTLEKKDGRMVVVGDPVRMVKKTIDIETR